MDSKFIERNLIYIFFQSNGTSPIKFQSIESVKHEYVPGIIQSIKEVTNGSLLQPELKNQVICK